MAAGGRRPVGAGGATVSGPRGLFVAFDGSRYAHRPACPACGDRSTARRSTADAPRVPTARPRATTSARGPGSTRRSDHLRRCRCSSAPTAAAGRAAGPAPEREGVSPCSGWRAGRRATQRRSTLRSVGAPRSPDHRHLIDVNVARAHGTCRPCSLLFDRAAAGAGGRPYGSCTTAARIDDLELDGAWADCAFLVRAAFFCNSTRPRA